jgi:hypothetical protein
VLPQDIMERRGSAFGLADPARQHEQPLAMLDTVA